MTGPKNLLLGLALAAMGLIVLFFSWINDSDLSPSRPTTLVIIGRPAGIVLASSTGTVSPSNNQRPISASPRPPLGDVTRANTSFAYI